MCRNMFVRCVLIAVSQLALCVPLTAHSEAAVSLAAPSFSLDARDGEAVSLDAHQGDVVMINFWASWCAPCREEMPLLEGLYQRYESLGFTLLGVNVDQDPSLAQAYLDEISVSFPVLFDTRNEVSQAYDVIAMPSTVLIARDGTLRYIHHGYQPGYEDDYQNQIRELIREP